MAWGEVSDRLIAWDIPAPPDYLDMKRSLYAIVVPELAALFEKGRDVDWRHVSWGGVGIDNRDIGMPYCTLCGSAQVDFTDELSDGIERPVLRTSGLLIRSNKLMYDVNTNSVFDTFLGTAVTGTLADAEFVLPQHTVITTTWGERKVAHHDTTILDQSLAMDRESDLRNTRDADGVQLVLDSGGLKAVHAEGDDIGSHQAFSFTWSQFHPGTTLWPEQ